MSIERSPAGRITYSLAGWNLCPEHFPCLSCDSSGAGASHPAPTGIEDQTASDSGHDTINSSVGPVDAAHRGDLLDHAAGPSPNGLSLSEGRDGPLIKGNTASGSAFGGGDAPYLSLACRGFGEGAPWVVARQEAGRQLLVAMETVPDSTLPGVAAHVQRLCDAAVPGMFL